MHYLVAVGRRATSIPPRAVAVGGYTYTYNIMTGKSVNGKKRKAGPLTYLLILGMERAFYFYLALPFTTGRSERASWLAESLARSSVPHSSAATHASLQTSRLGLASDRSLVLQVRAKRVFSGSQILESNLQCASKV